MNLTRRSVLGFGGLAAAAALSACGSNTGLGGKESSGGGPTLTQWYHQYGEEGVKEAVERYAAEYTAAKVDVKWNPGDYGSILAAQLLTNDVPDVFEVEQGGSLDMIRSGQLEDLTEIIAPVRDDFNEAVIKRFTFDGKIHGIPQTIDMQLLYYRPSLLQAAGVAAPATFDDLVKAANAVATSDMGGFFAGNKGGVDVLGPLLIWASGHDQRCGSHRRGLPHRRFLRGPFRLQGLLPVQRATEGGLGRLVLRRCLRQRRDGDAVGWFVVAA